MKKNITESCKDKVVRYFLLLKKKGNLRVQFSSAGC